MKRLLIAISAVLVGIAIACSSGESPVGTIDGPCKHEGDVRNDANGGNWQCVRIGDREYDWKRTG